MGAVEAPMPGAARGGRLQVELGFSSVILGITIFDGVAVGTVHGVNIKWGVGNGQMENYELVNCEWFLPIVRCSSGVGD